MALLTEHRHSPNEVAELRSGCIVPEQSAAGTAAGPDCRRQLRAKWSSCSNGPQCLPGVLPPAHSPLACKCACPSLGPPLYSKMSRPCSRSRRIARRAPSRSRSGPTEDRSMPAGHTTGTHVALSRDARRQRYPNDDTDYLFVLPTKQFNTKPLHVSLLSALS